MHSSITCDWIYKENVTSLALNEESEYAALTTSTGGVVILNPWSKVILNELYRGHKEAACDANFSPDNRNLVSSGLFEDHVVLWDAGTGAIVRKLKGPQTRGILCCAYYDRNLVFSGGKGGELCLWDDRSPQKIHGFKDAADTITCAISNSSIYQIVCGSLDGFVRTYDFRKTLLHEEFMHSSVNALTQCPAEISMPEEPSCVVCSCLNASLYVLDRANIFDGDMSAQPGPTNMLNKLSFKEQSLAHLDKVGITSRFVNGVFEVLAPTTKNAICAWDIAAPKGGLPHKTVNCDQLVRGLVPVKDNWRTSERIRILQERNVVASAPRTGAHLVYGDKGVQLSMII